jgi:hypothetical protein
LTSGTFDVDILIVGNFDVGSTSTITSVTNFLKSVTTFRYSRRF